MNLHVDFGNSPDAGRERKEQIMLKELLKKSRSYRGYDESRRITREELMEMVDSTRFAPSSMNVQPFQYLLVYEKEDTDKIQPLTGWAMNLPDYDLPHPGKCPTAFIIICQNTEWLHQGCRHRGADDDPQGNRDGAWRHHDRQLQPEKSRRGNEPARNHRSNARSRIRKTG